MLGAGWRLGLEPSFDMNGYPTEETLEVIREWPWNAGNQELMAYIRKAWRYEVEAPHVVDPSDSFYAALAERAAPEAELWAASTLGWSGNEELVDAMKANPFLASNWAATICGGRHYWFLPRNTVGTRSAGAPDQTRWRSGAAAVAQQEHGWFDKPLTEGLVSEPGLDWWSTASRPRGVGKRSRSACTKE